LADRVLQIPLIVGSQPTYIGDMKNNLTFCAKNGINFAINKRGEIFVTLNGYIKLSGKPKQTISERTTRAMLVGKVFETTALTDPGRGNRSSKLIPVALACEWLAKDNPELAEAVGGNLFGFLQEPIDLAQFHKKKAKVVEVVPTTEPATQASDLTVLDFAGKGIRFERRGDRIWVNLTDMAAASGKLVAGYTRLESTSRFITELESIMQICIMVSNVGGTPEQTGTWAIEEVAIDFAAWCSVGFRIWVAQQIRRLMTEGTVTITEPKPTPPLQPQLSSVDRVKVALDLKSVLEFSEMDANPRFKQSIQDLFGDILGLTQNSLPAPNASKWFGVAERAEQLGYSVALVVKHRSQLGKWVAERVGGSIKENRLCNGTQRPINVYPLSPELDEAIVSYLDQFS
jgi:KilA-N domain